MAKNYIQDGNTIRFSANQNIKSGDGKRTCRSGNYRCCHGR